MTSPKTFKNESQDARRRDQHNATHPEDQRYPKNKETKEEKQVKDAQDRGRDR